MVRIANMRLGTVLGGAFLAAGMLFAAIDSQILYRGWSAFGLDPLDKLSYGLAAASIPWVVIGYPFVWWVLWLRGRWRAVFPLSIAGAVYAVLIVYSLVGAMGSIASVRGQVVAEREASRESVDALKDQRARLRDQLGWIPKRRPAGQIAALIEAEKVKPQWRWTEGCRDINGPSQRSYCTGLAVLQGELESARKSDELTAKVESLSARIDGRAPVAAKADPMAASVAFWTGYSEVQTSLGLPIATPIVLLLGEMFFVWMGFLLLGINHRQLLAHPTPPRPGAALDDAVGALREAHARLSAPTASRSHQVQIATWFFAEHARPVVSGGLPEADWYAYYREECERSHDTPLALEDFRAIAQGAGAIATVVDGKWFYARLIPDRKKTKVG